MSDTVLVGEAVAGTSAKARAYVVALIENVNKQTLDLAEALYAVKSNGYYQEEFPTFREWTTSLGIKQRKAQYLTRIVEVMEQVDIPRTQYEKLGIAKLREITSLDPALTWKNPLDNTETPMKSFITDLVEAGADMELDDIKKHIRTLKGLTGENDIVWRNIPFTRIVAEKTIDPALELTRANIGSVGKDEEGISKDASDGACVEIWAVNYMNDPNSNPLNQELVNAEENAEGYEGVIENAIAEGEIEA
jgi:hypothetical protein